VVTGSAYKPQVEAISPTLPADDAHGNEIRHSIDELVSQIHRVDRDIQHLSNNLEKLKKKQVCYFFTNWQLVCLLLYLLSCTKTFHV